MIVKDENRYVLGYSNNGDDCDVDDDGDADGDCDCFLDGDGDCDLNEDFRFSCCSMFCHHLMLLGVVWFVLCLF